MWLKKPSNDRDWSPDQAILPHVTFESEALAHIDNVRNISYRSDGSYNPQYYGATYDLGAITGVRLAISPFWKWQAAHTFLIFDFASGPSLAISAEIRKPRNEVFNWRCLIPGHFEIMYVLADPRDVVGLRTDIWKASVDIYPLNLSPEQSQKLLRDMLGYAQRLETRTPSYHPFYRSCAINIVRHLRRAGARLPRFSWRYVLPARLDVVFARYGLLKAERERA